MAELEIKNLHVAAGDKQILKGLDLTVRSGEVHALMGPNGSGKSTLANAIMGHPGLEVTEGQILFDGEDITEAAPDERSRDGPVHGVPVPGLDPGVTVTKYLRMVMNAHRDARGEQEISLKEFRKTVEQAMELTERPEGVQLALPQRGLLRRREEAHGDPPARAPAARDRGARRDRLGPRHRRAERRRPRRQHRRARRDMGVLIITHYQRILHMVEPQRVSIMFDGRIAKEGGPELVDAARARGLRTDARGGRRGAPDMAATPAPDSARVPRRSTRGLVYLDSRRDVADAAPPSSTRWTSYYETTRASVHRGVYPLAVEATERFEAGRDKAAAWLRWDRGVHDLHAQRDRGDQPRRRTRGAARTSARATASSLTEMEHHSNLVPWQMLAQEMGATLEWVPIDDEGILDLRRSTASCRAATSSSSRSATCRT